MWWLILLSYQIITANSKYIKDDSTSVINGDLVNIEEYPFYVFLSAPNTHHLICGGALIQPNIILTAAHCLRGDKMDVWTGISSDEDFATAKAYKVDDARIHPQYNLSPTYRQTIHDIALLRLKEDVVLGDKVKLIALSKDKPTVGQQVTVVGFGMDVCDEFYKLFGRQCFNDVSTHLRQAVFNVTSFDDMVIESVGKGTQNVCYGDSGGPMVYDNKLIGIASEVELIDCTGKNTYTRVDNHLAWIQEYIDASNKNKNYRASHFFWW